MHLLNYKNATNGTSVKPPIHNVQRYRSSQFYRLYHAVNISLVVTANDKAYTLRRSGLSLETVFNQYSRRTIVLKNTEIHFLSSNISQDTSHTVRDIHSGR